MIPVAKTTPVAESRAEPLRARGTDTRQGHQQSNILGGIALLGETLFDLGQLLADGFEQAQVAIDDGAVALIEG